MFQFILHTCFELFQLCVSQSTMQSVPSVDLPRPTTGSKQNKKQLQDLKKPQNQCETKCVRKMPCAICARATSPSVILPVIRCLIICVFHAEAYVKVNIM